VHSVLEDNLKGTSGNLKVEGLDDAISRPVVIITSIASAIPMVSHVGW
jgi:hypothetical protein